MSSPAVVKVGVIAGNNLRRLIRQPAMLFTTLALPFMVIAIVGIALGGSQNRLDTGVVSHGSDTLSRGLVASLDSSPALDVTTFHSDADLDRAIRLGQVSAGIIVPSGYGTALLDGGHPTLRFVTTPDQTRAASIRTVLNSLLDRQTGQLQAATFSHDHTGRAVAAETARAQVLQSRVAVPTIGIRSLTKTKIQALGFDYTAPSNLVLFIIITSLTSSAALIESRTRGITSRMFTMPIGRITVIGGELLGRFVVAVAQAAVILVFSTLAFGVHWGDPVAVILITLAICAFGGALGLLVGFGARTMAQAVSFGPPLGIAMGMLGGCMWPLSIVGSAVRSVGHITPHAWAMDGYLKLINDRAGIVDILPQFAVVSGFALATLVLAGFVVRKRSVL